MPLLDAACRRWQVPVDVLRALREIRDTEPVAWMRAHAEDRFSLLIGTVGTGKTVAACVPLLTHFAERRWFKNGDEGKIVMPRSALFVSLSDMASWSLWDPVDRSMQRMAVDTELLVLDDLGTERGDGAAVVHAIIASRNAAQRRTVLTTNMAPPEFSERYGARILDRLRGEGSVFQATGASLRGGGA